MEGGGKTQAEKMHEKDGERERQNDGPNYVINHHTIIESLCHFQDSKTHFQVLILYLSTFLLS